MPKLTPEQAQQVVEMIPTARSFREIAREIGARLNNVRDVAVPIVTLMRMTGSLEPCPCGKPRFHPYACAGENNVLRKSGIRPTLSPELAARRELAIEMLVAGVRYRYIDDALGMGHGIARRYMRFLTLEQCDQRAAALKNRKRAGMPPRQMRANILAQQKSRRLEGLSPVDSWREAA